MLVRWWDGPPVLVIAPCPPEPAIQIKTAQGTGDLQVWVPRGPIAVRALTKKEERFFASKGLNAKLFKRSRIFAVSDEAARRFDTDIKAGEELAGRLGLSRDDLARIMEAKKRLRSLQPKTLDERRAVRGLIELLTYERPKKMRGRPGMTAEGRLQMRTEARQLRQEGNKTDQIVLTLAQRYELRTSYVKRVLEDALPDPQLPVRQDLQQLESKKSGKKCQRVQLTLREKNGDEGRDGDTHTLISSTPN